MIEAFEKPEISAKFGKNLRGNDGFYIDTVLIETKSAFTVFASHQIYNMMKTSIPDNERNYLMDATFDARSVSYYQLLGIYIQYKNDVSLVIDSCLCFVVLRHIKYVSKQTALF